MVVERFLFGGVEFMSKQLVFDAKTGETKIIEVEDIATEIVPLEPEPIVPEPKAPTMEQMALALMQTQAELEATTEALDFLIMGGI